jgi:acetylornithine/N-succinyldiaminopimelate aminotransferase
MMPVGLLLNAPRPDLLRFMPALNVTTAEIDQMIAMLDEVMTLEIASRNQAVPA